MSRRAAEMAKIMMEEWPENESAESFVLRRFYNDTFNDLDLATEIMSELEEADEIADDWFRRAARAPLSDNKS